MKLDEAKKIIQDILDNGIVASQGSYITSQIIFGGKTKEAIECILATVDALTQTNRELCSSHNALLADGARWQSRAEQAEAERDTLQIKLNKLQKDYDEKISTNSN